MFSSFLTLVILGTIGRTVGLSQTVYTPEDLKDAIQSALPGDVITLGPATFSGEFVLSSSGSPSAPITLVGINDKSKLVGTTSETAIIIEGSYWNLKYFSIQNYNFGVIVRSSGNSVNGLAIDGVNGAIDVEKDENAIKGCAINSAKDFGIRLQANNTNLSGNSLQGGIIIAENTCCGKISGNVANGKVEVMGSSYAFNGNVFQGGFVVSGCQNSFRGEVSISPVFTKKCDNLDLGGNVFM